MFNKRYFDKDNYVIEVQDKSNSYGLVRIYCLPDAVVSSCKIYLLYFSQEFSRLVLLSIQFLHKDGLKLLISEVHK